MTTRQPEWIDFNGFPALRVVAPDGATAIVAAYGSQVVSWIPARGVERLYLSERANYAAGKSIRGGVPVIFPQFADRGGAPRHGFARTMDWVFDDIRSGDDFTCVTFSLTDTAGTQTSWPHAFRAEMTVSVNANRLDLELEVENCGDEAFDFTAALHTYVRVNEVESVRIEGLHGKRYADSTLDGKESIDREEVLTVSAEMDRIYLDAPSTLLVREPGRSLALQSDGFRDVVVWNPWEEKCAALSDMPRNGFRRMLCIEAATVKRPIKLGPNAAWSGRQTLVAL